MTAPLSSGSFFQRISVEKPIEPKYFFSSTDNGQQRNKIDNYTKVRLGIKQIKNRPWPNNSIESVSLPVADNTFSRF